MALKPISIKQYLVEIQGIPEYYFTSAKGGKTMRDSEDYSDGVAGTTYKHLGFTSRENITLSKNFDPEADKAIFEWLEKRWTGEDTEPFSMSIQPVKVTLDAKQVENAGTFVYNGCEVVSLTYPEADREGSGLSKIEIELTWKTVAYQ